jgi:anti-sigma factor RsiW
MSCEKMVNEILPYIDGRLRANQRANVEKHLMTCTSCQLRLEEFHALTRLLDQLPVVDPSPGFDARMHALVAGEPFSKGWWHSLNLSPRAALAGSVLLVGALGLGSYELGRPPSLPWADPQLADEQMIQDLPVLEDYDLLSNFEPLREMPPLEPAESDSDTQRITGSEGSNNR